MVALEYESDETAGRIHQVRDGVEAFRGTPFGANPSLSPWTGWATSKQAMP
ncbi:hypothetical protein ACW0JT_12490 [Arthrobacter sp. SA17]